MVAGRVHYEVFGRKKAGESWLLEMATEDRAAAVTLAEDLVGRGFLAAKVTKEMLDDETREFASICICALGAPDDGKKKKEEKRQFEPLCVQPPDLYTLHARERIGRLLGRAQDRNLVTRFYRLQSS